MRRDLKEAVGKANPSLLLVHLMAEDLAVDPAVRSLFELGQERHGRGFVVARRNAITARAKDLE